MRCMMLALLSVAMTVSLSRADTGELILRAVDIDTGKPVSGVAFAVENGCAADCAVEVGKADAEGVLRRQARRRPGCYYTVWHCQRAVPRVLPAPGIT